MISILVRKNGNRTRDFLYSIRNKELFRDFDRYGRMGVDALSSSTPVDSGLTAQSWKYRVIRNHRWPGIEWYNTNIVNGTPVAILIQYGHGTRGGTYIQGRDFINPAMRPLFEQIADDIWKKVKSS